MGVKLLESKLLSLVTDKAELSFASVLLKDFNSFIKLTILPQDITTSHSEELFLKCCTDFSKILC